MKKAKKEVMKIKNSIRFVAIVFCVITGSPCLAAERILISYSSRSYAFLPAQVAVAKGFFRDENLEPVLKDLREFSDKVARNPELLGVGGAVRPSKGLKDAEMLNSKRPQTAQGPTVRGMSPR